MEIYVTVLAWLSLIIGSLFIAIACFILFVAFVSKAKVSIKIGCSFFFFVAMFVWPIIYFIVK